MGTPLRSSLPAFFAMTAVALYAAQDEKPAEKPAKEESFVVERADFHPLTEIEATVEPATKKQLRVLPEEFPGPYTVLEALPSGRRVEAGAVVMRLDPSGLERTLRGVREGLEAIKTKYDSLRRENESLQIANRLKIERMNYDLNAALREKAVFEKYGEEQMLKGKDLALKGQEFQVAERADELAQLEKMYKDSQLATDTKEIVLERARRTLAISRQLLDLNKKTQLQILDIDHPVKKEWLVLSIEQKKIDFELLKTASRLAEAQKGEELAGQIRYLRDQEERLARLEADLPLLTLRAPSAGLVVNRGLEAGDKASPHAVLAEVWDLSRYQVKFLASAGELSDLKPGVTGRLRLKDFPGEEMEAKIDDISWLPVSEGSDKPGVRFTVKAALEENPIFLRPGLKGRLEFKHEKIKKAVTIPRSNVIYKDDRTWCKIRTGGKVELRELILGRGDRERVHVEKGLSEGDTVVTKEGQPK